MKEPYLCDIGCGDWNCKNCNPKTTYIMKPKCNCEEMSCKKDCTRNHTHKGFFCQKCKPEQYEKVFSPQPEKECKKCACSCHHPSDCECENQCFFDGCPCKCHQPAEEKVEMETWYGKDGQPKKIMANGLQIFLHSSPDDWRERLKNYLPSKKVQDQDCTICDMCRNDIEGFIELELSKAQQEARQDERRKYESSFTECSCDENGKCVFHDFVGGEPLNRENVQQARESYQYSKGYDEGKREATEEERERAITLAESRIDLGKRQERSRILAEIEKWTDKNNGVKIMELVTTLLLLI